MRFQSFTALSAGLALCFAASGVVAQQDGMDHAGHAAQMAPEPRALPTEPGQSAFAAIAEIVEMLRADPQTDWSKVDIGALRQHLVDMNELTLNARVETGVEDGRIVFRATGEGRTRRAIQAMVPAHAQVLVSDLGMTADARLTERGADLILPVETEADRVRITALGFFGIMALGGHHQAHHLAMARGDGHPKEH